MYRKWDFCRWDASIGQHGTNKGEETLILFVKSINIGKQEGLSVVVYYLTGKYLRSIY